MIVTVTRNDAWSDAIAVEGELDINGIFIAYTLEPPNRIDKPRCIPEGTYQLQMLPSARWQRYMPYVMGVPGFTAVEIHPGNFPKDTDGCCLVGNSRFMDVIEQSEVAFNTLLDKLDFTFPVTIVYTSQNNA